MVWKHPPSILVIAILHLIGGISGLLCDLCGAGMQLGTETNPGMFQMGPPGPQQQKQQEFQEALQAHLDREVPFNRPVTYALMSFNVLLDVLLISAGIGLLHLKPWARMVSLVYAVFSLLEKVTAIGVGALTLGPLSAFVERTTQGDANLAMLGTFTKVGVVVAIVMNVLLAIYPIVVLVVLTRPRVKAAFSGQGPDVFPEAEERWGDDRGPPPETFTTREP